LTNDAEIRNLDRLRRFGATTVKHQGQNFIIGGVYHDTLPSGETEICTFDGKVVRDVPLDINMTPRPLFIGVAAASVGDKLLVMGGGAVCYAFGTYWNKGFYILE
jgi:tRNA wybutosine-synthesizing protein 4